MREFYEDVWSELPDDLTPYAFARRRAFLLAAVGPGDRVLDVGCGEGAFSAEPHFFVVLRNVLSRDDRLHTRHGFCRRRVD